MYRNPILVRKISHLTDARYFAAMGVDWISIALDQDPASFMRWHAIREWVEGLQLLAEIPSGDESLFAKTIIDAHPDGLLVLGDSSYTIPEDVTHFMDVRWNAFGHIPEHVKVILPYMPGESLALPAAISDPANVFLEASWTPQNLSSLLETGFEGGICLTGGQEDATGVRDYEEMDQLFDCLAAY